MSVKEKSSGYKKKSPASANQTQPQVPQSKGNALFNAAASAGGVEAINAAGDALGGDRQPPSGQGVPSYYNTKTQKGHPQSFDAIAVTIRTGVSTSTKGQEFIDALYEPGVGGFTRGWDGAIRAYQRGATKSEIKGLYGTLGSIQKNFGGDENAYFAALKKKADACEELIDRSPKWAGKELFRGYRGLSQDTLKALTDTSPGAIVNLNAGTASWSTSVSVARTFSSKYGGGLIAHVTGKRRGTSIKQGSFYTNENEVLCSKREAFRCVRVEAHSDGILHAYYEVVDTDYDWS